MEENWICIKKKVDRATISTLPLVSLLVLTFRSSLQEAKGKLLWD